MLILVIMLVLIPIWVFTFFWAVEGGSNYPMSLEQMNRDFNIRAAILGVVTAIIMIMALYGRMLI